MKKTYAKPELYFEDFSLSNNIATGCKTGVNSADLNTCGYQDPTFGGIIFNTTAVNSPCGIDGGNNGSNCTELPSAGLNTFGS